MTRVRPFLMPAIGLGALFFIADDLKSTRLVEQLSGTPTPMVAFIGFTACVVVILARLNPRG